MSTVEVDASGSRRAAPLRDTIRLANPNGVRKQSTNPHATRRPLPVEDGLLDLFAEVMSGLLDASREESHRTSRAIEPETSRRQSDDDQEAQAGSHRTNEKSASAEKRLTTHEESLDNSVAEKDQQPVEPVLSAVVADDPTLDSTSSIRASKPNLPTAEKHSASHGSETDAVSAQTQQASDRYRSFDRDSDSPAGSPVRDDHGVEGARSDETDRRPSQRLQRRLQRHLALQQSAPVDARIAKNADPSGATSLPESVRPVAARVEAAANLVESALPASQSSPAVTNGSMGVADLRISSSTDSASMRMGVSRSETSTPAINGVVASRESQSFGDAATSSNHSGTSRRSEVLARVKLISRVSKAFQHLGREGGMVRLRLAPAELGTVQVEMQVRHNRVRARVVAETEVATAALREHLPDLRARLESLGMQVERLDVEKESNAQGPRSDGSDSQRWRSTDDRPGTSGGFTPRSDYPGSAESESTAANSEPQPIEPTGSNSGVDLRL